MPASYDEENTGVEAVPGLHWAPYLAPGWLGIWGLCHIHGGL